MADESEEDVREVSKWLSSLTRASDASCTGAFIHPLTLINSVSKQRSGSQLAKWSTNSLCDAIGMPHHNLSEP